MLSSVVDECLSMALASASRRMSLIGNRSLARSQPWRAPLAAYPRLAAAMQRAEADGLIGRRAGRDFH